MTVSDITLAVAFALNELHDANAIVRDERDRAAAGTRRCDAAMQTWVHLNDLERMLLDLIPNRPRKHEIRRRVAR